ncbi:MAG: acyl-CoA dehydrogenase family protein [Spirochaetota bacterium]
MIVRNYFDDNPDLQFTLKHFVNWQEIIPLRENNFADFQKYRQTQDDRYALAPENTAQAVENCLDILQQVGEISGKNVASASRTMEEQGLKLVEGKVIFPDEFIKLYETVAGAGILSAPIGREYGGLNMPLPALMAMKEMLTRGDNSFEIAVAVSYLSNIVYKFCPEEMKEEFIPKIISGELTAAMGLSEPDFGSDLAHVRSKAVKQEDGSYRITGSKRFITHGCGIGDKPAIIFTLARTSGSGGKGLSFFLVHSKDVVVSRIEDKLGLHCSPTCELVYEDTPATLIGREGDGLIKYVIAMLNHGRLGVAVESVGVAQAALAEAQKYASERVQFGKTLDQIPAVKRMLDEMTAIVQAKRALVYRTAEVVERFELSHEKLVAEGQDARSIRKNPQIVELDKLAKLFTSIAKLMCSEYANKVAYDAVQIFGGAGFTEEYDISKLYRDARISTIYEGTTQIHINTASGVLVEGFKEGGVILEYIRKEIQDWKDTGKKDVVSTLLQECLTLMDAFKEKSSEDRLYLVRDIVYPFAHLFVFSLLGTQIQLSGEQSPENFAEEKQAVFDKYLLLTKNSIAMGKTSLLG